MNLYSVKTRDVDCSTSKRYRSLAGARKRFEEMLGYTMEAAITEQYGDDPIANGLPAVEQVKRLRGVSMFGTVVVFEKKAP